MKEFPVYALETAKNGPKLQQSKEGDSEGPDTNIRRGQIAALAARAAESNLPPAAIKQAIKNWRADEYRV